MNKNSLIALVLFSSSAFANAAGLASSLPVQSYCNLMADAGIVTNGWNDKSGQCTSNKLINGDAFAVAGPYKVEFFVSRPFGTTEQRLGTISLLARVADKKATGTATSKLIAAVDSLSVKLLGERHQGISAAISGGSEATFMTANWKIEVQAVDAELKTVRFKPR